jgi:hypothetical protein
MNVFEILGVRYEQFHTGMFGWLLSSNPDHPVYATHCPQCGYTLSAVDAQDMCREDEALCEPVACWRQLTSDVRVTIMEIAWSAR